MANLSKRRPENVPGNFYVDTTCIDCDTCRWMAPAVFHRAGEQSAVYHQPQEASEKLQAMQALLSCPTASIGTAKPPQEIKAAQQTFPLGIAENVLHCGYHAESSYGAASYLIQRPEGNILIDSPRFAPPLVKRLEAMGGIRYLYLTHRDDVADHAKFRQHFACDRLLHRDDITSATQGVEIQLSGSEQSEFAEDILIIPVPGHSRGHTVLLYRNKFLFSGDHLAWSAHLNHLYAFRRYCWYSWEEQIRSMQKLTAYQFEWVLPGHGRRYHANLPTMHQQLEQCIAWMRS
jgi:glyoxylase-like metal-dependent hydrolase (beta-lactamase superfamily II)/ferredoxin